MGWEAGILPHNWLAVGLLVVRIGGMLFTAPFLGSGAIPRPARAAIALLLALVMFPLVDVPQTVESTGVLFLWVAHELAVGLALGLVANLFFYGVMTGGEVIGVQMGLGAATALDPANDANLPVVGNLLNLFAIGIWFAVYGPHLLITAALESFHVVPPGSGLFGIQGLEGILTMTAMVFEVGVRVAGPVLIAMLLSMVCFGFLARSAPKMQVYVASFPITITFGLVILLVSIPAFARLTEAFTGHMPALLGEVLIHGTGG